MTKHGLSRKGHKMKKIYSVVSVDTVLDFCRDKNPGYKGQEALDFFLRTLFVANERKQNVQRKNR